MGNMNESRVQAGHIATYKDARVHLAIDGRIADRPRKWTFDALFDLERKGYREGLVEAPGKAELAGEQITSVRPIVKRTDGGFSRDVKVLDNGLKVEGE